MGWLITGGYALVVVVTFRAIFAPIALRAIDKSAAELAPYQDLIDRCRADDKPFFFTVALVAATFWPIAIIGVLLRWALMRAAGSLNTPNEIAERERRELEALRALAREHNLPMPGDGAR